MTTARPPKPPVGPCSHTHAFRRESPTTIVYECLVPGCHRMWAVPRVDAPPKKKPKRGARVVYLPTPPSGGAA